MYERSLQVGITKQSIGGTNRLELLGVESARNRLLKSRLLEALEALSLDIRIEEITEVSQLLNYDISGIPALAYNDRIIFQKIVPETETLKLILGALFLQQQQTWQMERILVPTGFPEALEATDGAYALALAKASGASLQLLQVAAAGAGAGRGVNAALEAQRRQLSLRTFLPMTKKERNLVPIEEFIRQGDFAGELLNTAISADSSLVALGVSGARGVWPKSVGRIVEDIVRQAPCPVLLTPDQTVFSDIKTIVYASDHDPNDMAMLALTADFAAYFGAVVHFVHVSNIGGTDVSVSQNGQTFQLGATPVILAEIEHKDVVEGLIGYATEHHADLVVMATQRRGLLEGFFHRSVTQRMIQRSPLPVLISHFEDHLSL